MAEIANTPDTSETGLMTIPSLQDQSPHPKGNTIPPEAFILQTADGCTIKGFSWRHSGASRGTRPVVIVNPATSVRCRYYFRFAVFLFEHGFDVIAYDYRGIG